MILGETAQALGDAVALEILALLEVVAGVVGRRPVRDGIDIQLDLLAGLRLANEHLAGRHKPGNQSKLGVIQMEGFAVHVPVHLRVGKKDFCWAALGDDLQHARLLQAP